jgi:hypothetical protein
MLLTLLIAVFCINACNKYQITNADLAEDLKKQIPPDINKLHTQSIIPNADGNGIDVLFELNSDVLTLKDNPSYAATYVTMLPDVFLGAFCDDKKVKPNMHKYVNTKNYLNIQINDANDEQLLLLKLTPEYCINYGINNFDASTAFKKQLKQGYYDENFLNIFYVPLMNKALPSKVNDQLTVTHAVAGPGSKLYIYLSYEPKNNETMDVAINNLNQEIQTIYALTCKNKDSRRLIGMLDEFSWFGSINDKEVTKLTASKTCN